MKVITSGHPETSEGERCPDDGARRAQDPLASNPALPSTAWLWAPACRRGNANACGIEQGRQVVKALARASTTRQIEAGQHLASANDRMIGMRAADDAAALVKR